MTRVKLVPVIPKRAPIPDAETARLAIEDALDTIASEAKDLYEKTVKTWDTDVTFTVHRVKGGRTVGTASKTFAFVDQGTRWHVIRPKRKKFLAFKAGGFKAKTRVGVLSSSKGSPGKTPTFVKVVYHPGTEARGFSELIQAKAQKAIGPEMTKRFKKLAR